jgi:hypothetical protein
VANRWALGAVVLAGGLQVLAAAAPPLSRVLGVRPVDGEAALVVLGLALVPAVLGQAIKTLHRPRAPARNR